MVVVKNSNTPYKTPLIPVSAYKIEFDIRTAIPTLQNTFDSGIKKDLRGGEGENELKLGGIGST